MKFKFLVLLFLFSASVAFAQSKGWHNDAHKAVAESNKFKKPLLVFFTGSDWCGWCKKLQKEVFNTTEFKNWASENVVLLELDFPRQNKQPENIQIQNQQIQQAFGVQGYPTVWFVSAEVKNGKTNFSPIGRTGYEAGGTKKWLATANSIINSN